MIDGSCSIVEAILCANTDLPVWDAALPGECPGGKGADEIRLQPKATYNLTRSYESNSGLPVIRSTVTIVGRGAIVQRQSGEYFRILRTASGVVRLKQLTIRNMGVVRTYHDPELEGVRMWRIAGIDSHLIFYRPTEAGVEIIRVVHGKRDIEDLFGGQQMGTGT